ncbi:MAG: TAXI family TRAP transporter solute-binding subunit [Dehalobacterium sp.]
MKKILSLVLIALILCVAVLGCTSEKNASPPASKEKEFKKFAIGSGSAGGGFFMGASALSSLINSVAKDRFEAVVEVTNASANNAELIQSRELELAMCSTDIAWEAYNGENVFKDFKCDKLRTVYPGWSGTYLFVTLDKNINDITGFNGKAYSGGAAASANAALTDRLFETFNVKANITHLPNADAARSLGDGTIKGFTTSYPSPQIQELETTHDVKLIVLTDEQKAVIKEKYPQYIWTSVPAGLFKNQPNELENIGLYNLFISSSDVSEDFIYDICKIAYENRDYLKTVHAQMAMDMDTANLSKTTIPYHAGAVKYFREIGVNIPNELLPPEVK